MTTRTITFVGFALIVVSAVSWAAVSARDPRWASLPSAWSEVVRRRTVRIVVVVAWIWLGWHLFARGTGAFE